MRLFVVTNQCIRDQLYNAINITDACIRDQLYNAIDITGACIGDQLYNSADITANTSLQQDTEEVSKKV